MKRTASPVARDEVASSSKKLRGIQSEEKRIVEDVNDLTAQIAALEQERRRKFDELQKQTAKFTEEAATYSQISTRHAVGDMRTKLPREIRDMIYHHLWDWSAIYAFAGLEKLTYNKCPGGECHCLRGIKIPRYLDPDFFGPDGAIEAAEALFRKLPWTTGLVRADDIKHILTNDPFHIGFSPLNAVRQLTVRFSLDRCARKERGTSREVRFYEKDLLSLQVLPEPERTAKWLQTYFEEDPAGKITRYRMCNMYMYCLGRLPFSPKNPPLPGLWEFVNEVKRVFPQTGSGMRYRIKHKSPAVTRHSWIDQVLAPNFNTLLDIQHKSNFKLHIQMVQRHQNKPLLRKILPLLSPIQEKFRNEGADVSIEYHLDRRDRRGQSSDDHPTSLPLDLPPQDSVSGFSALLDSIDDLRSRYQWKNEDKDPAELFRWDFFGDSATDSDEERDHTTRRRVIRPPRVSDEEDRFGEDMFDSDDSESERDGDEENAAGSGSETIEQ